jgi:hypothetical protein
MQPDARRGGRADQNNTKARRIPRTKSDDNISVCSHHSAATAESYGEYGVLDDQQEHEHQDQQPRKQRYRRRGSVTKYSLEAQETVQQEFDAHAQVIHQFRDHNMLEQIPQSTTLSSLSTINNNNTTTAKQLDSPGVLVEDDSFRSSPSHTNNNTTKKGKKKGIKGRLRRFTMGF